MSDRTDQPSESLSSPEPSELNEELPVILTGNDLSRMSSRAGITIADGLAATELDQDEEEEDSEGDYVAVGSEEMNDLSFWFRQPPVRQPTKLDELHPFVQTLTASNVDDCVNVENQAFPESERCSREKFLYRLTRCPELCLGLFTIPVLEEDEPKPRPTLVGHIVATRTSSPRVTDNSMKLPENWRSTRYTTENGVSIGHEDYGSTIVIHSLAVLPEHQGKSVGTTLLKAYLNRVKEADIAERIAIISHDNLVPFYTALGFENRGPSDCKFGGGNWIDLVYDFVY